MMDDENMEDDDDDEDFDENDPQLLVGVLQVQQVVFSPQAWVLKQFTFIYPLCACNSGT